MVSEQNFVIDKCIENILNRATEVRSPNSSRYGNSSSYSDSTLVGGMVAQILAPMVALVTQTLEND